MKRIVLTGGGSAGHVTPHLALLPRLRNMGWDVHYIGSHTGIERELMPESVPYYPIAAGKLRRYFHVKNFTDPLRVVWGLGQALRLLAKLRPDIVFSKGGFVSVPVTVAARLRGVPVVLHESDITPGLANRLSLRFANQICVTFPETLASLPSRRAIATGNPIRSELLSGDAHKGRRLVHPTASENPLILVMGGSLGSVKINQVVGEALPDLLCNFLVAHICGKGNLRSDLDHLDGYRQFEYVQEDLPHLLAAASLVISRAGANALFELLALAKPHILIPLPRSASRGDQILNAQSFASQGFSYVLNEGSLTASTLVAAVYDVNRDRHNYVHKMRQSALRDATEEVLAVIRATAK